MRPAAPSSSLYSDAPLPRGTNAPERSNLQGRPSSTRWTDLKPIIYRLYMEEDKSLKEVTEIMKDEYHFAPTQRSFKRWIAAWGWRKNIQVNQAKDDEVVRAALQSHYHSTTCETTNNYHVRLANGHFVAIDRLAEYMRRKKARMSSAAHQGYNLEQEFSIADFPGGIDTTGSMHILERIVVQTRNYTQTRHCGSSEFMDIKARTRLLMKHRHCSARYLDFLGDFEQALRQGLDDTLTLQLRRAPEALACIIRIQPYSILCCLYMLAVLMSGHLSLGNLMTSLMKYGITIAQSIGLPDSHPLLQILSTLPLISKAELSEVMNRTWGATSQSWSGLSLQEAMDSLIAARSSQDWVDGQRKADFMMGSWVGVSLHGIVEPVVPASQAQRRVDGVQHGDMMAYTVGVLDNLQKRCDIQYGPDDERSVRTLLARAEFNAVVATEKGLDCYHAPAVVKIYQEVLDRRGATGPGRALAMDFLKMRMEASGGKLSTNAQTTVKEPTC